MEKEKNEKIRFVIGLGNPGEKYRSSPHNLGRRLVEIIQEQKQYQWQKEKWFDKTDSVPSYVRLNTFMNLSGEAVASLLQKFACDPLQILVCCDDFSLLLGTFRIRKKGSAGSHNGLKSIIEHLGTQNFPRLRLGFGPLPKGEKTSDFVLSPFSKDQEKSAREMIQKASQSIQMIISDGLEFAMNRFNQKVNGSISSNKT